MPNTEQIRASFESKVEEVARRPPAGQGTATTRITLKPGLECDIEEGPWKLTAGMSAKWGGTNAGPNPGILGRGALGSCLAIGYAMWAARLGVPIDALEVEVLADYDSRGQLGIADEVAPGYLQVRYRVTVTSPASEADVQRVLDLADRHSPYRDVYARAQDVRREATIITSRGTSMTDSKVLLQNFQRDIDTGQPSILDRYFGGTYSDHNPPPFASKTPGLTGLKETFNAALGIFSEFKHVVDDQLAEGDKVVTRITGTGRHVGPFLGIPPTNAVVTMSGIAMHRVENGKLVEHWGQVDAVGLLTQMGVIPAPLTPPALPRPQARASASDRVLGANEMKVQLRSLFESGMNQRNFGILTDLIDPAYVNYSMPMLMPGPEGLRQVLDAFLSAFPDMHIVLEDIVAEPNKAATRGHFTGTHRGTFMNVPATGKGVTVQFIDIWKAHNGRFIENWVQMDMLGLLVQLGAVPAPA